MYNCIKVYMYTCIHVYLYSEREREREDSSCDIHTHAAAKSSSANIPAVPISGVRKGGFSKWGFSNNDIIKTHKLPNPPLLNPLCELPTIRSAKLQNELVLGMGIHAKLQFCSTVRKLPQTSRCSRLQKCYYSLCKAALQTRLGHGHGYECSVILLLSINIVIVIL